MIVVVVLVLGIYIISSLSLTYGIFQVLKTLGILLNIAK